MPGSLTAVPITSRSLAATSNPILSREGFWPGDFPGDPPGFIWGYGVLSASAITAIAGLYPPFYPGSTAYPGHGTTLGATPIT